VRRIVVAVAVATSIAIPSAAEAREYLTFREARTEVRDIVRTEMKRGNEVYEEGSDSIRCWRAPARLKDRASCVGTWSTTEGASYCGTARILEHRTYYSQHLIWQAGTYPLGHRCASVPRSLKPRLGASVVVAPLAGVVRVKPAGQSSSVRLLRARGSSSCRRSP
jgi:Ni/Co efflux regulator RcnB